MSVRKRRHMEPMSHDYLQEMIVAAHAEGTKVVLTVAEAEALMSEFAYYLSRRPQVALSTATTVKRPYK